MSSLVGVIHRETSRSCVNGLLWVSHRESLARGSPLGTAWLNPESLEPSYDFA